MITPELAQQFGPLLQKWYQQASALIPHIPNPVHREAAGEALAGWRDAFENLQRDGLKHVNAAKAEAEKIQGRAERTKEQILAQQEQLAELKARPKKKPEIELEPEPLPDWSVYQNIRAELLARFGKSVKGLGPRRDPGNVWDDWNWE